MINGRHLLWLGALASAGLVSVRAGQERVSTGYRVAEYEKQLSECREAIAKKQAELLSIQAPLRVLEQVRRLGLPVRPPSELSAFSNDSEQDSTGEPSSVRPEH